MKLSLCRLLVLRHNFNVFRSKKNSPCTMKEYWPSAFVDCDAKLFLATPDTCFNAKFKTESIIKKAKAPQLCYVATTWSNFSLSITHVPIAILFFTAERAVGGRWHFSESESHHGDFVIPLLELDARTSGIIFQFVWKRVRKLSIKYVFNRRF